MKVNNTASLKNANAVLSHAQDRRRAALGKIIATIAPGASLTERARIIGVSRQTLYNWLTGVGRPNLIKARKLAKLTGIPASEFHTGASSR
jgi:DNA-binding XRE family transcriptional regulator